MTKTNIFLLTFSNALIVIALISGCSNTWSGVKRDLGNLDKVYLEKTTQKEIMSLFGEPDAITYNKLQDLTTYQYKFVRNSGIGLSLAVLRVGKVADKGFNLNIMMQDDIVINFILVTMGTKWMSQ